MQPIPSTTTSPTGQTPQPNGAAKAGDVSIFSALIQALTGAPAASTAPATAAPGDLGGEAAAATAEGETSTEGGDDIDIAAMTPLAGMALPAPPPAAPALPQVPNTASTGAGATAPQPAPGSLHGSAVPAAVTGEPQAAPPSSAQAMDLAKVLPAGTQVHVTSETPVPPQPSPAANGVVALALQEAPAAAAAGPLIRAMGPEPKKPSSATPVLEPAAGDAVKTAPASEPGATVSGKSAGPAQQTVEVAPKPAAADADGAPAIPAPSPSLGSASPAQPEATAPEAAPAAAKGSDGQAPAFASTAATQSTDAAPERAAPFPLPAQPPAGQVSVHIAKAVRAGTDRIHIQLAPASLGRVEIALDLGDAQQVRATISAETKEALELLRADARVLERALNDAGLKTDAGSLSFQLRDQGARPGHDGGARQSHGAQPQARTPDDPRAGRAGETPAPAPAPLASRGQGRIDIHA